MLSNAQPIVIPEGTLLSSSQEKDSISQLSPLRILVVEDNLNTQKILCEVLTKLGHLVKGYSSAEEALQEFEQNRFEVLLTDVNLPGMSGVDLARQVFAQEPATKIIIASGYGAIASDEFEFETVFMPKPFNIEKLKNVLTDVSSSIPYVSNAENA